MLMKYNGTFKSDFYNILHCYRSQSDLEETLCSDYNDLIFHILVYIFFVFPVVFLMHSGTIWAPSSGQGAPGSWRPLPRGWHRAALGLASQMPTGMIQGLCSFHPKSSTVVPSHHPSPALLPVPHSGLIGTVSAKKDSGSGFPGSSQNVRCRRGRGNGRGERTGDLLKDPGTTFNNKKPPYFLHSRGTLRHLSPDFLRTEIVNVVIVGDKSTATTLKCDISISPPRSVSPRAWSATGAFKIPELFWRPLGRTGIPCDGREPSRAVREGVLESVTQVCPCRCVLTPGWMCSDSHSRAHYTCQGTDGSRGMDV